MDKSHGYTTTETTIIELFNKQRYGIPYVLIAENVSVDSSQTLEDAVGALIGSGAIVRDIDGYYHAVQQ